MNIHFDVCTFEVDKL